MTLKKSSKNNLNFSFINLGCTKNLVDTQVLMGKIFDLGQNNPHYEVNYITDPYNSQVEYIFLNTCGFLKAGRDEMFRTIEKILQKGKKIYLLGCALQFFKTMAQNNPQWAALTKNPNIHALSRNDFEKISLSRLIQGYDSERFHDFQFTKAPRAYTNAQYRFEYLKIAEGCDNHCTFCIIPRIRGKQRSLAIPKILEEIKNMIKAGIEEIIIISQDTTRYGTDLYGKPALFKLLQEIEKIPGKFRYRLLYLYPDTLSLEHLKKLQKFKKFLPYFDIPFQHISSHLLKRMGRFYDEKQIFAFLDFIKKAFPISYIRTNFIIGFPGERDEDQKKLIGFINKDYFNNIALFEYHDEDFAASSKLDKKVPDSIIRKRFTEVRQLVNQKLLALEEARKGKKQIGYIMDMYGNPSLSHSTLTVRPSLHAPEIDPYDEISPLQIIKIHNKTNEISIGERISYKT